MVSLKGSHGSQGFYHKPFKARLIATVHRAGIVGIELVILLFHVVKIVHYLHHLVFGAVMLLQRRTKQAVGLGMTEFSFMWPATFKVRTTLLLPPRMVSVKARSAFLVFVNRVIS